MQITEPREQTLAQLRGELEHACYCRDALVYQITKR